jgi:hypothetical protein
MIRFSLRCTSDHEFEGWFRSGDSFEAQQQGGEIACPECGDHQVEKALMAPAISRGKSTSPQLTPAQMKAMLLAVRRQVESNCDYVGERFAEEARRIHYGETDPHGIYGEASESESRELAEEGIEFGRIPWVQTDA